MTGPIRVLGVAMVPWHLPSELKDNVISRVNCRKTQLFGRT